MMQKKMRENGFYIPQQPFSIFVSSLDSCRRRALGISANAIGISVASLTIPYLLLNALTSKKTENFNSKDKQLYEKVYFEEYKKENIKIL